MKYYFGVAKGLGLFSRRGDMRSHLLFLFDSQYTQYFLTNRHQILKYTPQKHTQSREDTNLMQFSKKFTISCPLKSPACHRKYSLLEINSRSGLSSSRSHRQRKTEGKRELTPNNFSGDLPAPAGNVFVPCVVREQVDAPLAAVRLSFPLPPFFGCSFLPFLS